MMYGIQSAWQVGVEGAGALLWGGDVWHSERVFQGVVGDDGGGGERIVGICMDAGLNFFDTADIYSDGE